MTAAADVPAPCPQCGAVVQLVHVHGHGQCPICHTNVEPCCAGASAADEVPATAAHDLPFDAHLFARVFARLGSTQQTDTTTTTVTAQALLHVLVTMLDCDLDGARLVLEAGLRVGCLHEVGSAKPVTASGALLRLGPRAR